MEKLAERREMLRAGNPDSRIMVIVDNMLYASEVQDQIIWDDENERLFILKLNEDHRDPSRPYKIQSIDYSIVICLEVTTNKRGVTEPALACGFSKADIDKFITELSTINL